VHYHGDDYASPGSPRRIRTFYGSAIDEALHAVKPERAAYQLLFYAFEWMSCLRRGVSAGISRATVRALPLIRHVIPCGVSLARYRPSRERSPAPSILFIGDLHSRKRGAALLDIFRTQVLPSCPKCTLTVVGPEPCRGAGIEYAGVVNEQRLISLYQRSWVYCMASSYEGFGAPAIEAMACGTPVVAVRNPGIIDIIGDSSTGLLCSLSELGDRLVRALTDDALRCRLADAALQDVKQRFAITETARRYVSLYHDMIQGRVRT
jgi:glycosyltransferase involved in cell wall biosynthesis